jgi:hypothetical protein
MRRAELFLRKLEANAVVTIAQAIEIPLVDRNRPDRGLALAKEEREGIRSGDEEMDTARAAAGGSANGAQQG